MAQKPRIDIRAEGSTTYVKIRGYIYEWAQVNSRDFENRVDECIAQGATNLEVSINSPGGDPFEANQMGIVLEKFEGVKTCILESMAASSATIFLGKFDKVKCHSNTQIMVHSPKGYFSGTADEIEASVKALRLMKEGMIEGYVKLTGLKKEKIEDMLKNDYWMDAKEAKKLGFVSEIIKSKAESIDKADLEAAAEHKLEIPFQIAALATETDNLKSTNTMSKIFMLAAALGLKGDDATNEEKIIIEANKAINEVNSLKLQLTQKDTEITALKDADKNKSVERANAAIEAAFKDNKLTAEQKTKFLEQAKTNPEFVTEMVATMQPYKPVTERLNNETGEGKLGSLEAKMESRKDWNWSQWSKDDSDGLAKMKAEKPEGYKELFKAEFGKYPK